MKNRRSKKTISSNVRYFDYAAATPVRPEVRRRMREVERDHYANPHSLHAPGRAAGAVLEEARAECARALGVRRSEIVFTSGGTESNNLAILGALGASARTERAHMVTSAIEHPSVLEPVRAAERRGARATRVAVAKSGVARIRDIESAIAPETVLVTLAHVNNELGTIAPVREIARMLDKKRKTRGGRYPLFHIDAAQSPRYLSVHADALGADLITLDAAKMYGPQGIGVLYVKHGTPLAPLLFGGGQEGGARAGTESMVLAAGFARALSLAVRERKDEWKRLLLLKNFFIERLREKVAGARINGHSAKAVPGITNIRFHGIDAEELLVALDVRGFAVSTASACSSIGAPVSHVVEATTGSRAHAKESVRISFGRETRRNDIQKLIAALAEITGAA